MNRRNFLRVFICCLPVAFLFSGATLGDYVGTVAKSPLSGWLPEGDLFVAFDESGGKWSQEERNKLLDIAREWGENVDGRWNIYPAASLGSGESPQIVYRKQQTNPDDLGYTYSTYGIKRVIKESVVTIGSNLSGRIYTYALYHETGHAFGLYGHPGGQVALTSFMETSPPEIITTAALHVGGSDRVTIRKWYEIGIRQARL
jgi:hypothetical protein